MDIAALGIKIDSSGAVKATSDLDSFTSAASKAEKAASGIGSGASSAAKSFDEMDRATQRSAASTATLALNLSRFGAILGSALSVREVIKAADSWTGLENRLRLVTTSAEQLAKATGDVYSIAQRTSAGIESTADVYQKFASNANTLGLSMAKVASLTDTVSKSIAISGSSAQAADNALMQFGQAIGGGILRAEEFNSIIEQAPGLMQALADGLGVAVGQMRSLANEGKITSQVIVEALTKAAGSVDEKFNTRVKTVEQSMTELNNAFVKYVGQLDKSTGATNLVSGAIGTLAENIDSVLNVAIVAGAAGFARYAGGAALATVSLANKANQTRKNVAEELALAKADLASALAAEANAKAQLGLTTTLAAQEAASNKAAAAKARVTAAQSAMAVTGRSLLGILGGPVGIAVTAGLVATSFFSLRGAAEEGSKGVDLLTKSFRDLDEAQTEQALAQIQDPYRQAKEEAQKYAAQVEYLNVQLKQFPNSAMAKEWNETMVEARGKYSSAAQTLVQYIQRIDELQAKMTGFQNIVPTGAIDKTNEAAAKYLERLADQSITAGLKTQTEQLNALVAAGKLVFSPEKLADAQKYAKTIDDAAKSNSASVKTMANAYATLTSEIQAKIEENRLELMLGEKTSESDKIRIKLEQELASGKTKLTAAQRSSIQAGIKSLAVTEKELAMTKLFLAATANRIDLSESAVKSAYDELARNQELLEAFGMSAIAVERLTLAKLRDQLASKESLGLDAQKVKALELIIEAQEKNIDVMGQLAAKQKEADAWQQWADEVGQIFDQVGQKLTDAIFDGGKSGRELVKDLFKTLTLRVLVQPVMGALQGAFTQSFGNALGIGQQQGGDSGLLSGVSNVSTLYRAFTGGISSSIGGLAQSIGGAIGSEAISAFGLGMSGAAGAAGTVAGISAIGSGLGASLGASIGTSAATMATTTLSAGIAGSAGAAGTGIVGSVAGGGAAGAGLTAAAAVPWVAGAVAAAAIAQKAFGLGGKEKTGEGFAGWIKGSRGGQDVLTYETASRSGGWLRSGANYLDFRAGDPAVQAGISDLVAQTSSSLKAYADALALNTQDIQEYAKHIFVPTMDKSAQEIQERILSEVNLYAQELTRDFWPALQDVRRGGEELTDTLARIAGSIQTVNPVLEMLNLKTFDLSIQGGELASKFTDLFGGIEGFAGATGAYYDAFFTEQEKFDNGLRSMSARLGEIGVVLPDLSQSTDDVRKQYRAMIEAQDLSTEIGQRNAAILIQSSTAVLGLSEAATSLAEAAKAADESVQDMTAILNERAGLERQIMQLMGDTEGLRRRDLAAIDESNRALQQHVWALEDQAAAAQAAAATASAVTALRNQADTLLGNIEAVRARELQGMDSTAAAWQRYVWAIEDEQKRQAKAVEQYRIDLADWQRLQDAVGEAFREVQRIATSEIEKLRDAARQTDAAMAALTKRVQAQSDLINKQVSGLEALLGTMRSVFDYIGAQVRDLRGGSGSRGMYAQQGRDFIAQALSGGSVPDLGRLTEAVASIRDEMAATEYGSSFERDYAANVLANQLEALQDRTEPQISLAEQQLKLAQDQLKQLEEMVKKAQEAIDETRGVKDNTGDLKVSWDAYTDALATTLDQSASFNAVISAIESGNMLSQAAWAEQLNKWDSSLGSAQKQYDALKALVDAGLVTDAGTQAQIDALGALLSEAQKQVGVLEGVDTNTGASGTAGEQVKKLQDLFDEATKQIDALSGVESTTSWTKDLYDKVLSATTYEAWAVKQIEGVNKQLELAQKQLDSFNGVSEKATTMIEALNNMAAALKAAQVAQPTNPGTGGGTGTGGGQIDTGGITVKVPDTVTTASHGFDRLDVLGKRHYKPTDIGEGVDYVNLQPDILAAFKKQVAAGAYSDNGAGKFAFAKNHWDQYVVPNKSGQEHTRRYATGGNHSGGLRLVGEFGPELEATGPSRVYNHMKTQDILRNAFTGNGTMGPEMATLTRHAEQMIRTIETMGRATVFQLQRIARQLERWDTDGMPETRDMVAA